MDRTTDREKFNYKFYYGNKRDKKWKVLADAAELKELNSIVELQRARSKSLRKTMPMVFWGWEISAHFSPPSSLIKTISLAKIVD